MKPTTLVFVLRNDGEVLLGRKRRGFGAGKWNGFGGKVRDGETLTACAVRELVEETGLAADPADLEWAGELQFRFAEHSETDHPARIYRLYRVTGEPQMTEEMEPRWFLPSEVPYDEMWAADRNWVPRVLAGERIAGEVVFAADGETVLSQRLRTVEVDDAAES